MLEVKVIFFLHFSLCVTLLMLSIKISNFSFVKLKNNIFNSNSDKLPNIEANFVIIKSYGQK